MEVIIPEANFIVIRDYIQNISGIFLDYQKEYLIRQKLQSFVDKYFDSDFKNFAEYLEQGQILSNQDQLHIISAITTNETSFFRDGHPYETIKNILLPKLFQKKSFIKIWSAGCSTGQETYSMAILLSEYFEKNIHHHAEILAIDIDPLAVQRASKGQYNHVEIERGLTKEQVNRYFTKTDKSTWTILPKLRENIQFRQQSLHKVNAKTIFEEFDLILLRNVLIYFHDRTKKEIIRYLHQSLCKNGYLLLGASESLYGMGCNFVNENYNQTIVYMKSNKDE